jgi:hypothetical protein
MKQGLRELIGRVPGAAAVGRYLRDRLFPGPARRQRFADTYARNYWGGDESRSGPGSSVARTAAVREMLPILCRELEVHTLLDVPCGDMNWMQYVDLPGVRYIGADIVPALISANAERFGGPSRSFMALDVVASAPPRVDLVLCRDLLVHLSFQDIARALNNLRQSGSEWLLTTTFNEHAENDDLAARDWRPLNLERPPFVFPAPRRHILEHSTENDGRYADKSLGLWRIGDLP